uniref:Uncharacterized protein n=1 Tax=Heterorhabditis bacteriophora TaxID=37862 RepID=A0A1I7WAI4_HETBA
MENRKNKVCYHFETRCIFTQQIINL